MLSKQLLQCIWFLIRSCWCFVVGYYCIGDCSLCRTFIELLFLLVESDFVKKHVAYNIEQDICWMYEIMGRWVRRNEKEHADKRVSKTLSFNQMPSIIRDIAFMLWFFLLRFRAYSVMLIYIYYHQALGNHRQTMFNQLKIFKSNRKNQLAPTLHLRDKWQILKIVSHFRDIFIGHKTAAPNVLIQWL